MTVAFVAFLTEHALPVAGLLALLWFWWCARRAIEIEKEERARDRERDERARLLRTLDARHRERLGLDDDAPITVNTYDYRRPIAPVTIPRRTPPGRGPTSS